jgi:3-hydroxyacyl-CoA dehydrogenase
VRSLVADNTAKDATIGTLADTAKDATIGTLAADNTAKDATIAAKDIIIENLTSKLAIKEAEVNAIAAALDH